MSVDFSNYKEPKIDYLNIDFPTDKMTIGQVRRMYPDRFRHNDFTGNFGNTEAADTMWLEHHAAEVAFNGARGIVDRSEGADFDYIVEQLMDGYRELGLPSGRHQVEQIVRDIQAAAREQVPPEHRRPRTPGR